RSRRRVWARGRPSGARIIAPVVHWNLMAQQPLAYLNQEFLESNDSRPIRILSEYLEPLRRFKDQKIQDTVVFFGSARVDSRERAERALQTLRARGDRSADAKYEQEDRKSTRLNSSHVKISYAVFCLKKK